MRRGHARTLASRLELDAADRRGLPDHDGGRARDPDHRASCPAGTAWSATRCSTPSTIASSTSSPAGTSGWIPRPGSGCRRSSSGRRTSGVASFAIGHSRFRDSGFTAAVLRGAEYLAGGRRSRPGSTARSSCSADPGPRSSTSTSPTSTRSRTATASSRASGPRALESLDAVVARLVARPRRRARGCSSPPITESSTSRPRRRSSSARSCSSGCATSRASRGACSSTSSRTSTPRRSPSAGGSTRGRAPGSAPASEAIEAGWFGPVDPDVLDRIGEVLVAARRPVAYYADPEDRGRADGRAARLAHAGRDRDPAAPVRSRSAPQSRRRGQVVVGTCAEDDLVPARHRGATLASLADRRGRGRDRRRRRACRRRAPRSGASVDRVERDVDEPHGSRRGVGGEVAFVLEIERLALAATATEGIEQVGGVVRRTGLLRRLVRVRRLRIGQLAGAEEVDGLEHRALVVAAVVDPERAAVEPAVGRRGGVGVLVDGNRAQAGEQARPAARPAARARPPRR